METFSGAGSGDDEGDGGAGLDAAVFVLRRFFSRVSVACLWLEEEEEEEKSGSEKSTHRGCNLGHVEVVFLGCSVADCVLRNDETVARGRFGFGRVRVALYE